MFFEIYPVIRLSSLLHRRKYGIAVLLTTSLFYSGFLTADSVKVAFTGDQGAGEGARAVLSMIASEGVDLLMIQGDLGYDDGKAATWEENLTQALGANFPVLTVVGNHENFEWPLYKRFIQQRIDRVDDLSCSGDTGVRALCRYKNIDIVQVSPGIDEVEGVNGQDNYADFIASSFAESTAPWRICAWHKNQSKMQTGSKSDATGWGVYDACLDAGAMIALAHEHAYSRSYLLSDFENQSVAHKNSEMTLEPGRSFAFVSGLGGHEVRDQQQGGDWWASIYTASQGATHGALFCTFEDATANCYFKAIDGAVPDQFTLKTRVGSASQPPDGVVTADAADSDPVSVEPEPLAAEPVHTEPAELPAPDVTELAAAPVPAEEQSAVVETEVAELSMSEAVTENDNQTDSVSEPVSTSLETADTGPLTVVPAAGVVTETAAIPAPAPAVPDSEVSVSASPSVKGGSAGGDIDVGSGSVSILLLLAMLARFRMGAVLRWVRRTGNDTALCSRSH